MPFDTVPFTVQRNNTTLYTELEVQLDGFSLQEASMLNQQGPFDAFDAYIVDMNPLPTLIRGDIFIDERNPEGLDPSGRPYRYTLLGRPILYNDSGDLHSEMRLICYIGG